MSRSVLTLIAAVAFLLPLQGLPLSPAYAVSPTVTTTLSAASLPAHSSGHAQPSDTITYTATVAATVADALGVTFTDTVDANTTFVPGSTTATPMAVNDTYPQTVIGNVAINSASIPYSVLSNDFMGLNPTATITAYDSTTTQGGQIMMTTTGAGAGQFTYNPPPGFQGPSDSFTYTIHSSLGSSTATVTIPVSGMVWFINNNAAACTTLAAGCGRLSNPFSTLAAFNTLNNGASDNPAANENIFVYESSTAYSGAVTLLSGQKLVGQDATASLATITGLAPPSGSASFPAMNSTNATITDLTSTVTLNTNATVRGLSISSTTSTGMNDPAAAITGVSVSEVSVTTTTGTAVSLSNNTGGTFSFKSISSSGAANGINLSSVTGDSFTVTGDGTNSGSGGTISASTAEGVLVNSAGAISLAYMTIQNSGTDGIHVTGSTGFTLDHSNVTDSAGGATDEGVLLNNNTGTMTI
ncbi:MAG TPA: hypothetical protein VG815_04925, partial [Chloroflexota bacterium]|nr:hypothetical protein [Chloroflexota bacterium]